MAGPTGPFATALLIRKYSDFRMHGGVMPPGGPDPHPHVKCALDTRTDRPVGRQRQRTWAATTTIIAAGVRLSQNWEMQQVKTALFFFNSLYELYICILYRYTYYVIM